MPRRTEGLGLVMDLEALFLRLPDQTLLYLDYLLMVNQA